MVGALADSKRDMMGSWSAAGVADQSVTVLTGIKEALGDNGKVIYAKGANVTDDKGIVDFLNLYENAVQVDPRSPQEMIDGGRGGEAIRCGGRRGGRGAGHGA